MQAQDETLRFRATDLSTFGSCRHATLLDREAARGLLQRPHRNDPAKQLLEERGMQHGRRYLELLEARHGGDVFRVPGGIPKSVEQWKLATLRTLEAMRAGHQVIYQAPLAEPGWQGLADFLVRVPHAPGDPPSPLGDYHYEVVDTKLARQTRGGAILQLCVYSHILASLQGMMPEHLVVATPAATDSALGTGPVEHRYRTADFLAYFRLIRQRFEVFARDGELRDVYPEPVDQCDLCAWWPRCDKRRRDDDHLSLVAGMGRAHRDVLEAAGIVTLASLGALRLPLAACVPRLPTQSLERLHQQARLQLEARSAPPRYDLLPVEAGRGLSRLPVPSPGDIFFDIEADRYAVDGTLHYLLGWVVAASGASSYRGLWAMTRLEEKKNFESFIDEVLARRARHPDLHVYHFAAFERTALALMAARYATREEQVDDLFRNGVLVDLMPVVKQGLRAGVESYSIKALEQLYAYSRGTDLRAASRARRLFELHRELDDLDAMPDVVPTIEAYNREDCESTLHLQSWLERLRAEHETMGLEVPRPAVTNDPPGEELSAWGLRVESIRQRLIAGISPIPEERTAEEHARQLLADLVDWHRRESKPGWREYFRLLDLTEDELFEDSSALGSIGSEVCKGRIPGTRSERYEYPYPEQEHGFEVGDAVECPFTRQRLGTVIEVDRAAHVLAVKRSGTLEHAPRAVIERNDEPPLKELQKALAEVAEGLIEGFQSAAPHGHFAAAATLLLRGAPRLDGGVPLQLEGEPAASAMCRVAPHLRDTVLAVQGPPGAGKTYAGSRLIVELVRAGKKVGITATSHNVIRHLLEGAHEAARQASAPGSPVSLLSIQKAKSGDGFFDHPNNTLARDTAHVAALLQSGAAHVAAGTAWMWCDPRLRRSVDVLVIDEAGQFSLANTLAVSVATQSIVLLGDPQQLAQPSKGSHPLGAEASALEHLLDGAPTIPAGQGLFMDRTWRLPPAIARFTSQYFYAGRLEAHPDCTRQLLRPALGAQRFTGTGIFFDPIEHDGNVSASSEEADRVAAIFTELLQPGATWTNRDGKDQPITTRDILIVAPYNAQVQAITERLTALGHPAARVGTVDKFQGQEAPIVIYSMATSTPEHAPRGFEFLYSLNRLNVATSRSQAVVIIVASPRLLEAQCKMPRQMRLVNGFCGAVAGMV